MLKNEHEQLIDATCEYNFKYNTACKLKSTVPPRVFIKLNRREEGNSC